MRIQASWLLAAAGVAMVSSAALADYSRNITVTAQYAITDNLGNPILGAGGETQMRSVPRTFNIDTDFVAEGADAEGTIWYQYTGDTRFGELSTPDNNPSLTGMRIGVKADPMVVANFNVASGIVNTTFTVQSTLLSYPTITGGVAVATAAMSVTDSATFGNVGQISVTGLQAGGNAFAARFNGNTVNFANLILSGNASVVPGSTTVFTGSNASFPLYDTVLAGSTFDMQSEFRFTLSRFDRAAGTSTFEVIPAPGTAVLIALGGLTVARRRRAR